MKRIAATMNDLLHAFWSSFHQPYYNRHSFLWKLIVFTVSDRKNVPLQD